MAVLIQEKEIPVSETDTWIPQKQKHEERTAALLNDYLEKRSRHIKNPVMDFLFEYYTFRPSQLKRWSPGTGQVLAYEHPAQLPEISELTLQDGRAYLDPRHFPANRISSAQWILNLLEETRHRKPSFGCFGMHEWAMVYKTDKPRHNQVPLRMNKDDIADFVESRPLLCTHFDAFRFFTEDARPMNKYYLDREHFVDNEQPGCIHTNMDLYKWAYKLYPWIPSNLILDAFGFACRARVIDMKASPYDLSSFGLSPIRIETESGRKQYLDEQQRLWKEGNRIRTRLIESYRTIFEFL